jgi:hypothetical protein
VVVTIGTWSWVTIDLCKISTVELRLCEATDGASPCETFWLLVNVEYDEKQKVRWRDFLGLDGNPPG